MNKKGAIMMVGVEGPADKSKVKDWQKWYNEKHIPEIMQFPGIRKVTRYEKMSDNGKVPHPQYFAVYEFDSPESAEAYDKSPVQKAAAADSAATWGQGGTRMLWRAQYRVTSTFEK